MKKAIAMVLAMAMLLALAACGAVDSGDSTTSSSGTSNDTNSDSGTNSNVDSIAWEDTVVNIGIKVDPGTLGPYETNNDGRKQILYSVYETLAYYQGRGGEIEGVMAKNWYEEEPQTYIVELYDYITDSKGNQITADDVIFSYMDAGYSTFVRYLKYIDSIEALDEYTLKIVINSDAVGVFDHIICNCWIVDQDSYESTGDGMANEPIGTGPYEMTAYTLGSVLTLEARDDYWQEENLRVLYQYQNVKTINFKVITEATQQIIAMETGDVDMLVDKLADSSSISRFMDSDDYYIKTSVSNETRTLFFNCTDNSVCSDVRVRQAICYALDNAMLVSGVLDGNGEVATGYGNATVYSDFDASWGADGYYEYNVETAKALLEEAGYGSGLTIRILAATNDINEGVLNIAQQYLTQAGITLEAMQYENALAKTYAQDFTMFDVYLAYSGSPDYIITCWNNDLSNTAWGDVNYCGMNDSELQALIDLCYTTDGHTTENMTELYNYLTDNCLCYGLFNPYIFNVGNSSVVTEIVSNESYWVLPGCCEYVWND